MDFDEQKFKELILLLAEQCAGDRYWGATKLNKQLFFCDFLCYRETGQPMTGADYMALAMGPGPRYLRRTRDQMVEEGEIELVRRASQHRIAPLRSADTEMFSPEERAIIDNVLGRLRDSTSDEVSELSHKFVGWKAAIAEGEALDANVSIPYETVFVRCSALTQEEIQETLRMADEYKWPV